MSDQFTMSPTVRDRMNASSSPRAGSINNINDPRTAFTFITADQTPPGNDVLRRAVAFWKVGDDANSRVLMDRIGERKHLFFGSNKVAFFGYGQSHWPGTTGNVLTFPDASHLSITGDIDIRVMAALDDWTPATDHHLVSKWLTTGAQRSFRLLVTTSGSLQLQWSTDGTTVLSASAVPPGVVDGQYIWLRAALVVSTGTVTLYTSPDGAIWTAFHTSAAGETSIFDGTANVEVGANQGSTSISGKLDRVQIFRGVDGTLPVLAVRLSGRQDSTLTTTDDGLIIFVDEARYLIGERGLWLSAIAGEYAFTDHTADLNFTGDADVSALATLVNWHDSVEQVLASKWQSSGQYSWKFSIENNRLVWRWSNNGTTVNTATSPDFDILIADGSTRWVRVTHDVNDGAGGNIVKFWFGTDGGTWEEYAESVNSGTTSIFAGSSEIAAGAALMGQTMLYGGIVQFAVRQGIDGDVLTNPRFNEQPIKTLVFEDAYERVWEAIDVRNTATLTQVTASAQDPALTGGVVVIAPGDYLEALDVAALDIGADEPLTLAVLLAHATWNESATEAVIGKRGAHTGNGAGYQIVTKADGDYEFKIGDGTTSSAAVADGIVHVAEDNVLVVGRRDPTGNTLQLTVNRVEGTSVADATGSLANAEPLRVGQFGAGGGNATFDFLAAAVWKEYLSDDDVSAIELEMRSSP